MRLLFVYDARVLQDKLGQKYTDGAFSSDLWKRYTLLSEDFHILLRDSDFVLSEEDVCKYSKIDDSISVKVAPDIVRPKINIINPFVRKKINNIVADEIKISDCVIVRMPSFLGEIAIKYAKKYKKKYLIELVGDVWRAGIYHGSIYGIILAIVKTVKNKFLVYTAPYVLYVSNTYLQKRYPTKGKNIGCPDVILEKPDENVLNKRLRRIHKKKELIILGLIGSMAVNYRGHAIAMKTVRELISLGKNVQIRFLGGGHQEKWKKLACALGIVDNVEFCGTLPGGSLVLEWIDNIDILFMPTKQETLGRAVIEAMSRGCPVVGSSDTAIREQIGSDCLANSSDYLGYTKIIKRIIEDEAYAEYCAKENFYRSFKYCNNQTNPIRENFYFSFINSV